jgi:hypothetical protein
MLVLVASALKLCCQKRIPLPAMGHQWNSDSDSDNTPSHPSVPLPCLEQSDYEKTRQENILKCKAIGEELMKEYEAFAQAGRGSSSKRKKKVSH